MVKALGKKKSTTLRPLNEERVRLRPWQSVPVKSGALSPTASIFFSVLLGLT
jgi:hypothetical protein